MRVYFKNGAKIPQRRCLPRSSCGEKAQSRLCWARSWGYRLKQRWGASHSRIRGNKARQHTKQTEVQHLRQRETSEEKCVLPKTAEFSLQCTGETERMGVHISRLCEVNGDNGSRTFDPAGTFPEWTWRWWLSWWPLDMCRSALPRSELRRRVCGIPRGRTRKWLPASNSWEPLEPKRTTVTSSLQSHTWVPAEACKLQTADVNLGKYLKDCFMSHGEGVGWSIGER
ncbi:hypothetical protein AAFF_G00393640 [Aldrovandia affinis]|uniref:Uncharacterized protein n=1 Tax=Aldrovandia affinis TaxID=143900 RepID=A0AAD7SDI4_9TELE|nr:hypothetical protein AAFF_G00393640 [Aldrovandia affinis]